MRLLQLVNGFIKAITDGSGSGIDADTVDGLHAADIASGLETIDEGNGDGLAIIGRVAANYGNLGFHAVDLSYSGAASNIMGATGLGSFAGGENTIASGSRSHAEGYGNEANGSNSHAEGTQTIAQNIASHAAGNYNVGTATDTIHETGIGASPVDRKNAFEIFTDGTLTAPESTISLIDSRGNKALVTKEYVNVYGTAITALTDSLTGDVMADSEHRHSELSASDGIPNPALSVDASGNIGIGTASPAAKVEIKGSGTGAGKTLTVTDSNGTQIFQIIDNGNMSIGQRGASYKFDLLAESSTATSMFRMGIFGVTNGFTLTSDVSNNLNLGLIGDFTVTGDGWFSGDVSALTFTDRTPFYDGDAVGKIKLISGINGEIDHSTLPDFVKVNKIVELEDENGELTGETEQVIERNLGNMISVLTKAVQQLTERIELLESK